MFWQYASLCLDSEGGLPTYANLFAGIVWTLFSDAATALFVKDLNQFEHIGILKGVLFVIVTDVFLYLLIRYYVQHLKSSQETFLQAEQEIKNLRNCNQVTN